MTKACSKDDWNLTPEQDSRWESAIAEYTRITDEIVERQWASLSPEKQEQFGGKETIRWFSGINPPGHKKSALFRRLLNGTAALPFIPPTRYSYPWYAPFDRPDQTHDVIDVIASGKKESHGHTRQGNWLLVDQTYWDTIWANPPAISSAKWGDIDWGGGEALATDQDINNEKPVFLIKYGAAPLCRLTTGRTIRKMRRAALEHRSNDNPMDIGLGHPVIKEIISTRDGEPRMDLLEVEVDTWTLQVVD
jgi:hypothetical protein